MEINVKQDRKELFKKASHIALDNAVELFEDAAILFELKRYPRAFSLGILTCEEMAKTFIYQCVALEILQEDEINKLVKVHEEKILKSGHLMTLAILFSDHMDEIVKAINHDNDKPDHKDHIFNDVMNKYGMHSAAIVVKNLINAQSLKLDSLYVHVRENKIINPKDVADEKKCEELFTIIGKTMSLLKYLKDKDDVFVLYTEKFLKGTINEIKDIAKKRKKK